MKKFVKIILFSFIIVKVQAQEIELVEPINHSVIEVNYVTFRWNKIDKAQHYEFQISQDSTFQSFENKIVDVNHTEWELEFNKNYFWKIRFFSNEGYSNWSDTYVVLSIDIKNYAALSIWLKGDSLIQHLDGSIYKWSDVSSNSYNASQTNLSYQPTYVNFTLGDKGFVYFDGIDDFLNLGNVLNIDSIRSVFILLKQLSFSNFPTYISKGFNQEGSYVLGSYENQNYFNIWIENERFVGNYNLNSNWNIISNINNPSDSSVKVFYNGIEKFSSTTNQDFTGSNSSDFHLGNLVNSYFFNGYIAEILIFNEVLGDVDRTNVEHYLRYKYAPPANLGVNITSYYNIGDTSITPGLHFDSYLWSTGDTTPTLTVTEPGKYWVDVVDIFGFPSSDTIIVWWPQINNIPDTAFCVGDTLVWNPEMSDDYSYQWSNGETGNMLEIYEPGDYYLILTDTLGNKSYSDTAHIEVDDFELTTSLGNDTSICFGSPITLHTDDIGAIDYLWNDLYTDSLIFFTGEGNYWIKATNRNNCVATDTVFITSRGLPPEVDFGPVTGCAGNQMQFTDYSIAPEGADIIAWNWNFGDGVLSTQQNPSHNFSADSIYHVSLTVNTTQGCSQEFSTDFVVYKLPEPKIFNPLRDKVFINRPGYFYDATVNDTIGIVDSIVDWLWTFDDGTFSVKQNPVHRYGNLGTYNIGLTIKSLNGCSASENISVDVVSYDTLPGGFSLLKPIQNFITEDTNITFSWNKSPGADYYKLLIATDNTFTDTLFKQNNITTTSFTVNDIQENETYFWKVLAFNSYADSSISNTLSFKITNPAAFPKMQLWLNANRGISMGVDSLVSGWQNQVRDSNSFSQSTQAYKPKFIAQSGLNNKPALLFDGTDDFLNGGNVHNLGYNSRNIFIVGKSNTDNGNFLSKARVAPFFAENIFAVLVFGNKLNFVYQDLLSISTNSAFTLGQYSFIQAITNRNSLKNELYLNKVLRSTKYGIEGIEYNFNNTNRFLIGAYNYIDDIGQTYYLDGEIAEIMVMDTVLTDAENQVVYDYLLNKYAPPVFLGHDIFISYGFKDTLIAGPDEYASYLWSNGATTRNLLVSGTGTYWLSVTDAYGFQSIDSIRVSFPEMQRMHDTVLCLFDTISWNTGLSHEYNFKWQDNSTDSVLKIFNEGYYYVAVTDSFNNTIYSDTIFVELDSFPQIPSLGPDLNVCRGGEISLLQGRNEVIGYYWNDGSTDSLLQVETSGNYSLVVVNDNNCFAFDTVLVNISGVAPIAEFTATGFCPGNPTQFTSISTIEDPNNIISWEWNFGSGNNISGEQVSNTFDLPGEYNVRLTVESDGACLSSTTKKIKIDDLQAGFSTFPDSLGCINIPVTFQDESQSSFYTVDTWQWAFDDGYYSAYQNPTHGYDSTGIYQVGLNVFTKQDCESYIVQDISILNEFAEPQDFSLINPANNGYISDTNITFSWNASENAYVYKFQLANDPSFEDIVIEKTGITQTSLKLKINYQQIYYWRVIAQNICHDKKTSPVHTLYLFRNNTIPGMQLWLKADKGVTIADSTIGGWEDQSGYARNAFQTDFESSQPKYVSSAPNEQKSIYFDGVDDFLKIDSNIVPSTVFVVANWEGTEQVFPGYNGILTGQESNNNNVLFAANAGTYNLYSSGLFGSNIYINQEQQLNFSPLNNYKIIYATTDSTNLNGLYIGKNRIYNYYWKGNIAEILVYDEKLNQENIDKVVQYLHYKYAPPVNLGSNITIPYGFNEIELFADGEFVNYLWSTGEDTIAIMVNQSGFYSVTVTDIFGFESSDQIKVTYPKINQLYDTKICYGDTLRWNSGLNDDYTFLWQDSSSMPYFDITRAGQYSVMVSDSFGNLRYSDTITVNIDSFPIETGFYPDTNLCIGSVLDLSFGSENVISYLWNNGSQDDFTLVNQEGLYSVVSRNAFGCYSYDTIWVDTIGVAPVAGFIADTVCYGNPTSFLNQSQQGDISPLISFNWNFENGLFSTEYEPQYVFSTPGNVLVSLNVVAENGCENIYQHYITTHPLPNVNFKPEITCSGSPVHFIDLSTSPSAEIIERRWVFEDTIVENQTDVIYKFNVPGNVPVQLIVTNSNTCTGQNTKLINVKSGVHADFDFSPACFGEDIYFEDKSESDIGLSTSWEWNFGDDSISYLNNPVHKYDTIGNYLVSLIIKQMSNGCSDTVVKVVDVYENPIAVLNDFIACKNTYFTYFDSSTINQGFISSRRWDIQELGSFYGNNPVVSFADTGKYNTRLIVISDNDCKDTANSLTIVKPNPIADFVFTPSTGVLDQDVVFENLSEGAIQYLWEFGDGGQSSDMNPIYTYNDTGVYQVVLKAYSEFECMANIESEIKIHEAIYDISVLEIKLDLSTAKIGLEVSFANVGSVGITGLEMAVSYENGGAFSEIIQQEIPANTIYKHKFASNIKLEDGKKPGFICVEAILPEEQTDFDEENNIKCVSLDDQLFAYNPFPNPSTNSVTILFNMVFEADAEIYLVNNHGDKVKQIFSGVALQGLNKIDYDITTLPQGIYSYVIITQGQSFTRRFVKL